MFFGDYDEHKWHDMRPLLAIDKLVLVMFSVILIVIGVYPAIIVPIVESGMAPVIDRLHEAQQTITVLDSVQTAVVNIFSWVGGA